MRWRKSNGYKLMAFLIIIAIVFLFYSIQEINTRANFNTTWKALPDLSKSIKNNLIYLIKNTSNFEYLIPNNICKAYNDLLAIIIVTSYVGNDKVRAAHREAIAQNYLQEIGMLRVFLMGSIPEREQIVNQQLLEDEQNRFGDLLQGNFKDTYKNLSYKHIMGLRWSVMDCGQASYIVKMDDDTIYDIFKIRQYLELSSDTFNDNFLAGNVMSNSVVYRDEESRWFVSQDEYLAFVYPDYLSGFLYITSKHTAKRLVQEASKTPLLWVDDAFVTGVLRKRLNITLEWLNSWYTMSSNYFACCIQDLKIYNYDCEYFIGPTNGNESLLVEFIRNVEKCYFNGCVKRPENKSLAKTCSY